VLAPAQAFVEQDLVDPAALHRNPFVLVQVGRSSVERPGGKGQPECLRLAQRTRDHGGGLLGRIRRPAARTGPILEGFHAFRIEAADALAHGLAIKANPACNCGGALAATGMPDDLGALRVLSRSRA
jgi:hypothetical protein